MSSSSAIEWERYYWNSHEHRRHVYASNRSDADAFSDFRHWKIASSMEPKTNQIALYSKNIITTQFPLFCCAFPWWKWLVLVSVDARHFSASVSHILSFTRTRTWKQWNKCFPFSWRNRRGSSSLPVSETTNVFDSRNTLQTMHVSICFSCTRNWKGFPVNMCCPYFNAFFLSSRSFFYSLNFPFNFRDMSTEVSLDCQRDVHLHNV